MCLGLRALAMALGVVAGLPCAQAAIQVKVDLTQQQMIVEVDGRRTHTWAVSTANSRYVTPTGSYRPYRMHKMWYSRKYDDAPMPHAIFYSGGFAIHGTNAVRMLGRPASHGCVRLAPGNAAILFSLVQQHGMGATRIVIHGSPPKYREPAVAQRPSPRVVYVAQPEPGLLSGLLGWSQPTYLPPQRIQRRAIR
jgi:hypothetical protein